MIGYESPIEKAKYCNWDIRDKLLFIIAEALCLGIREIAPRSSRILRDELNKMKEWPK